MKIFVMILVVLYIASTISVSLSGEYVNLRWFPKGPIVFTLQVGGVVVHKPNDHTVGISAINSFQSTNIQCLTMDYNSMKYLPANYTRFFPSITFLIVRHAQVQYVTNADFLGLWNLTHLDFQHNEIEHLPGNLFQEVTRTLSFVSFADNRITNVGPNFIANIPGLETLNLSENPCINMNSPATFDSFTEMFTTKCQSPIIPDALTSPFQTFEEYNKLKTTTIDLMNQNENIKAQLKSSNDKIKELENNIDFEDKHKLSLELDSCKLSTTNIRTELSNARKYHQTNDKIKSNI